MFLKDTCMYKKFLKIKNLSHFYLLFFVFHINFVLLYFSCLLQTIYIYISFLKKLFFVFDKCFNTSSVIIYRKMHL